MHTDSWLTVDRVGLGKLLERRGKGFAAVELLSNAFDEDGVTSVVVTLEPVPGKPLARLVVSDDSTDGFTDLTHSFTLFAESKKKSDAERRGRFNLGEKLVLAIATEASVVSTTGSVHFKGDGTRSRSSKSSMTSGTMFAGTLRMTRSEIDEALNLLYSVIVPDGITVTINDVELPHRKPTRTITVTLPTEIADADGNLRRSTRSTDVMLYEPIAGETPTIYELGIPVVEHDAAWHVDVGQKVPLNFDRDNVTPTYLRKIRTLIVDAAADLLDADEAAKPWVAEGMEDADSTSVERVLDARFGKKRVIYDPSDREASKRAMDRGYAVITGGALSSRQWAAVKNTGTTFAAGKVMPSGIKTSSNGKPPIDPAEYTPGMSKLAEYTKLVGKHLLGYQPYVKITSLPFSEKRWAAMWGNCTITFNVGVLGHAWFDSPQPLKVDALLLHEFAHEKVDDHLSDAFHTECCRLGALLRSCDVTLR